MKCAYLDHYQRTNEQALVNVAAENDQHLNKTSLVVNDLACLACSLSTWRYIIQQRRDISELEIYFLKTEQEKNNNFLDYILCFLSDIAVCTVTCTVTESTLTRCYSKIVKKARLYQISHIKNSIKLTLLEIWLYCTLTSRVINIDLCEEMRVGPL